MTLQYQRKLFDQTNVPVMLLSMLSNIVLLVTLWWNKSFGVTVYFILGSMCLNVYRAYAAKRRLGEDEVNIRNFERHLYLTSALSGFMTGMIYSLIVMTNSPELKMLGLILLAGTVAGSTNMYSSFPKAGYLYTFLAIAPVSASLFTLMHFNGVIIGVLTIMFGFSIVISIKKSGKILIESLKRLLQLDQLNYELTQSKTLLQKTLDHMPGPVYAKNLRGEFIFVNEKYKQQIKPFQSNLIGMKYENIYPQEIALRKEELDLQIIQEQKTIHQEDVVNYQGQELIFDTYKFPLLDEIGVAYAMAVASIDITAKKQAERELESQRKIAQHSSKLASIGELAAGVGHEINNPLSIIMGKVSILERAIGAQEFDQKKILNDLEKMHLAGQRIKNIVQGLRTFARSDSSEKIKFDLCQMVRETLGMIAEIYHKDLIKLDIDVPPEEIQLEGNYGRLQQVLINLVSNAKDATEGVPTRLIQVKVKAEDNVVSVEVTDNGCGMTQEVQEKIFEPFFTTKDIHKGTGIGLALVYQIINEHGGKIQVRSSPGRGTSICFSLIRIPSVGVTQLLSRDQETPITKKFRGKVLVVDDEPAIREVMLLYLEDLGFDVDEAEDGVVALSKLKSQKFDILLTDMKMPNMGGEELIKKTRSELSYQPLILVVTGGVNVNFEDKTSPLHSLINGYLYKPFDQNLIEKLLTRVMGVSKAA